MAMQLIVQLAPNGRQRRSCCRHPLGFCISTAACTLHYQSEVLLAVNDEQTFKGGLRQVCVYSRLQTSNLPVSCHHARTMHGMLSWLWSPLAAQQQPIAGMPERHLRCVHPVHLPQDIRSGASSFHQLSGGYRHCM
jgi:hypothetical protein